MLTKRMRIPVAAGLAISLLALSDVAPSAKAAGECKIGAVGDIAEKGNESTAKKTAAVAQKSGAVAILGLGDLAYEDGSASEFANVYDPTWGPLNKIMKPTPGNHEYQTSNASGYFGYFKGVAPNYSFDACGWHFISLDAENDVDAAAAFIKSDGAKHAGKNIGVYWHKPRFSSGDHGDEKGVQPLWEAAAAIGAKLAFGGHDHNYERFAPMDASGKASPNGIRQFVVGTGGKSPRSIKPKSETSEKTLNKHGVLIVSLRPNGYDFDFQQIDGTSGDSGTMNFTGSTGSTGDSASPTTTPMSKPTTTRPTVPGSSVPLSDSTIDVVPSTGTARVDLVPQNGAVLIKVQGMPPNAPITISLRLGAASGQRTFKTRSDGRIWVRARPRADLKGTLQVTAKSGTKTATSSVALTGAAVRAP